MKIFIVFLDCKRDVLTKVFIAAETEGVALSTAKYVWGRTVREIRPLIDEDEEEAYELKQSA